jgi:hypothetical protein
MRAVSTLPNPLPLAMKQAPGLQADRDFSCSGVDSNHDLWVMRLSAVVSRGASVSFRQFNWTTNDAQRPSCYVAFRAIS